MPLKFCSVCGDEFYARWRNTPAVCVACSLAVVICPGCWHVTVKDDPAQLALFDVRTMERRGVWWSVDALVRSHFANAVPRSFDWESYTEHLLTTRPAPRDTEETAPWPRRATMAERRRYPFH